MTKKLTEEEKLSRGNFRNEEGKLYIVRCPMCKQENYAPAVASGQCVWCGYKEEEEEEEAND